MIPRCNRQFSRYSCPRCNLAYCSLPCFRSPAHNRCSEAFYRSQLETDIRSAPSKSAQERQQMMEMLKRFEEQNIEEDGGDDEDEDDGLDKRLEGLDIENVSYEQLWGILSPDERNQFLSAVQDPSSDLAQQLLATSSELESMSPWWECQSESDNPLPSLEITPSTLKKSKRPGRRPDLMSHPLILASDRISPSFPLAYNLVAIVVAYAFTTRHFSASPLFDSLPETMTGDARQLVRSLVPFLSDKKSTTKFVTLEAAITYVWSRFEPGSMTPASFSLLLNDTALLLHPQRVTVLDSGTSSPSLEVSPHLNALLALSDLHALFAPDAGSHKAQRAHTAVKIQFYAAQLSSTAVGILEGLSQEVGGKAHRKGAQGYVGEL
ncbi:hypothetical protein K488DRAFT_46671 [Vararia minispora EC-137]|uniref:Uncharacterized protein n=1 Tax=Vararia minispora EC-137 TaxID=1314806 RepID=A0ACB8QQM4_9AGAM|nr:hypothetical protein K488DRAFT_46671 [Vararia minispora EC-137]